MKGGIYMMKWKAKKGTINVGSIDLDNVNFNEDYIQVCVDVCDMSHELKTEINKAIEIEKVRYSNEWDEIFTKHEDLKRYNTTWSNKPVEIEYTCLIIVLEIGKPAHYTISTGFCDADNDRLESIAVVDVDLSAHTNELKKAIIHVLIDRFF